MKNQILESYTRSASTYDDLYREEQVRKFRTVIQHIEFTKEDYILDAGCGTALFVEPLGSIGCHIVGVDFAGHMLKIARDKTRAENVDFVMADIDALPFISSAFTKILAITLVQNLYDPIATIDELERVIKSGGTVALSGLRIKWPETLSRYLQDEREAQIIDASEINDIIAFYRKKPEHIHEDCYAQDRAGGQTRIDSDELPNSPQLS